MNTARSRPRRRTDVASAWNNVPVVSRASTTASNIGRSLTRLRLAMSLATGAGLTVVFGKS